MNARACLHNKNNANRKARARARRGAHTGIYCGRIQKTSGCSVKMKSDAVGLKTRGIFIEERVREREYQNSEASLSLVIFI